nr:hypothetical protein [Candidatus Levybacteria bacterium]
MTKKQIKKLISASYIKNNLDSARVNRISKQLTRQELKLFIKLLKNYDQSKTVTLLVSSILASNEIVKQIKKMYSDKNVVIKEDKSLVAGIRLIDNDTIYDVNIKNSLNEMVSFIKN